MSRMAAAWLRARTTTGDTADVRDDPSGQSIPIFDPSSPAVVAPEVAPANAAWSAASNPAGCVRLQPAAAMLSRREQGFFSHVPPPGSLPDRRPAGAHTLALRRTITPQGREQYRKLAAALYQAQLERGLKVVSFTSVMPREGKTFTAANLALAFSESQRRRVLLIDADLRWPAVHEVFGLPNRSGLSDSWVQDEPSPLAQVAGGLWVLTAGRRSGDPMETLTSDRFRLLIQEARATFDWVFLDTPPVGLVSDAKVVASWADLTLLVILADQTPYDVAQAALQALGPQCPVGVVLNRVADSAFPPAVLTKVHDCEPS